MPRISTAREARNPGARRLRRLHGPRLRFENPHEFLNLADDAAHAATLAELTSHLTQWRRRTSDPLLKPENLQRLKAEVDACIVDGEARKGRLELTYPDYFFSSRR